jgi:hypothetical protein
MKMEFCTENYRKLFSQEELHEIDLSHESHSLKPIKVSHGGIDITVAISCRMPGG